MRLIRVDKHRLVRSPSAWLDESKCYEEIQFNKKTKLTLVTIK